MHPTHQVADGGPLHPEGQLGGGGALQPHLLLEAGGNDAVPIPQRAVGFDQELGDDEQGQALGAGHRPLRACQHQMHDVLGGVVLAARDEPLHPLQVIGVALHVDGPGGAGPDVGAGVGLGEDHRARPLPVDHHPGQVALLFGALLEDDPGEEAAAEVEDGGGVGPHQELLGGPEQGGRDLTPSQVLRESQAGPAGCPRRRQARLDRLRKDHLALH